MPEPKRKPWTRRIPRRSSFAWGPYSPFRVVRAVQCDACGETTHYPGRDGWIYRWRRPPYAQWGRGRVETRCPRCQGDRDA
jgi:hypothetical protein